MFYHVFIKNKITGKILHTGECTENDINFWKQKAIITSKNFDVPTILRFEPKAIEFEYFPRSKIIPSPKNIPDPIENKIIDPALAAQYEGN